MTQKNPILSSYQSYALDSTISNGEANRMSLIGIVRNQNSCPLRVTSFHHCYNTNVGPLLPIITHFATAFTLVRIRSHQGKALVYVLYCQLLNFTHISFLLLLLRLLFTATA